MEHFCWSYTHVQGDSYQSTKTLKTKHTVTMSHIIDLVYSQTHSTHTSKPTQAYTQTEIQKNEINKIENRHNFLTIF